MAMDYLQNLSKGLSEKLSLFALLKVVSRHTTTGRGSTSVQLIKNDDKSQKLIKLFFLPWKNDPIFLRS